MIVRMNQGPEGRFHKSELRSNKNYSVSKCIHYRNARARGLCLVMTYIFHEYLSGDHFVL